MSGKINRRVKKSAAKAKKKTEKAKPVPILKEPEPPVESVREPESYDEPTPETPAPGERGFFGKVGDFLDGK